MKIPNTFKLDNLDTTLKLAYELASTLTDSPDSCALLFYGEMGAGKTTLVRALGTALGIQEKITSPTFIGLNEYHLPELSFYHFDLYQVQTSFEGLSEIMLNGNQKRILAIEWAEKLNPQQLAFLQKYLQTWELSFVIIDDERRELTLTEPNKICS